MEAPETQPEPAEGDEGQDAPAGDPGGGEEAGTTAPDQPGPPEHEHAGEGGQDQEHMEEPSSEERGFTDPEEGADTPDDESDDGGEGQ